MRVETIQFTNNRGSVLSGRLYHPEKARGHGVLFCHGFFSSKDAVKIIRMSEAIVNAGFTLMTFDFSFVAGGDFSRFSVLQEVEDLRSALDFFLGTGVSSVHLTGSSMGGLVALLFAAEGHASVKSLSLIATPVRLEELLWNLSGGIDPREIPVEGMSRIDGVALHNSFFRETLAIDMERTIRAVAVPVLIIHGVKDPVVDISNARLLDTSLQAEHKSVFISDGEHNLVRDGDMEILKENILGWIRAHSI